MSEVVTVCPYCGAGCEMVLKVEKGKVVEIKPLEEDDNFLCPKGVRAQEFIQHEGRLRRPLIRRNGNLEEAGWEEAIDLIATKLASLVAEHGPDSLGFLGSGTITNEENYVFQKFARAVIGTNNVDHCATLCHGTSVAAMTQALGSGAATNCFEDIPKAEVLFIIGYNPEASHPKIFERRIWKSKWLGNKVIVADTRRTSVAKDVDVFMQCKPGTDVVYLNAMANVIIAEGLENKEFINSRTEGFEEFKQVVARYTPEYAEKISGVPAETIKEAARIYATSGSSAILWGMGITQHTHGTDNVYAIVNLALLTGNVGRVNAGLNPMRGQNNVQGACDMGMLRTVYPGAQPVDDPKVKAKFAQLWGTDSLPDKVGFASTEFIPQALEGKIKGLYIVAENPAVSHANLNEITKALDQVEFMVVQDLFLTETARYADVVLPSCSWLEKDGTYTRGDRKVQRVRAALPPLGESKTDWEIISLIAAKMGKGSLFAYTNTADIFDEIGKASDKYAGISHARIDLEGGIYWPCPSSDSPGTPTLHLEEFPRGLGKFTPVDYVDPAEAPDAEYSLILTTGRDYHHFGTRVMTRKVAFLNQESPEAYLEINPEDASKYQIETGDRVKVASRRGDITVTANVTPDILPGVVFIPWHFAEQPVNKLTNDALDPVAKTPETKVCAVKISKC
ncbi:MAG: formate dehydrogenase subunit alpha [Bacillota bacterium]